MFLLCYINLHTIKSYTLLMIAANCIKCVHMTCNEQVSVHSKYSLGGVLFGNAGGSG